MEIEGYDLFHTASKISKGGTSIYASKDFESLERTDLKINNPEFESTWIEIKNKKSKNIVIGCLYRHPHNNHVEFFQYLDGCLDKLAKENKELYLCGDVNFYLLKIDTDSYSKILQLTLMLWFSSSHYSTHKTLNKHFNSN